MNYISSTHYERKQMLAAIGAGGFDDLYESVPQSLIYKGGFANIAADGLSEAEVKERIDGIAAKNKAYTAVFRGAGAYNHFIPACVRHLASRSEFVTAYTPYQPEISQGVLQAIFEYQTTVCALTGMDVSNASVYDGAAAAAEAVSMCAAAGKRRAVISGAVNPGTLEVIKTYCKALNVEPVLCPCKVGRTDIDALTSLIDDNTACVYAETPNFYGLIEDGAALANAAHSRGAKLIAGVNPISLAVLRAPAEYGADIAVGKLPGFICFLEIKSKAAVGNKIITHGFMLVNRTQNIAADILSDNAFAFVLHARDPKNFEPVA